MSVRGEIARKRVPREAYLVQAFQVRHRSFSNPKRTTLNLKLETSNSTPETNGVIAYLALHCRPSMKPTGSLLRDSETYTARLIFAVLRLAKNSVEVLYE
jgi:hypothetical protein